MDDSGVVCRFERLGDLPRDRKGLVERDWSESKAICDRVPGTSSITSARTVWAWPGPAGRDSSTP
jgi:hypothetical protein